MTIFNTALRIKKAMGKQRGKTIAVRDFDERLWLEFKALAVKKKMKLAEALEEAIKMWIDRKKAEEAPKK